MKKLLFGLGLVIVLAGCSSNSVSNSYPTPTSNAPFDNLTSFAMDTPVPIPDVCQWLTKEEAAKLLSPLVNITTDNSWGTVSNTVLQTESMCAWKGFGKPGSPVPGGGVVTTCAGTDSTDIPTLAGDYQRNMQNGWGSDWIARAKNPAYNYEDLEEEPAPNLTSEAYLATAHYPEGVYTVWVAEIGFLNGPVACFLFASTDQSNGGTLGAALMAFAHQLLVQDIQPLVPSSSTTATAVPVITPAPSVANVGGTPYVTFRLEAQTILGIRSSLIDTITACNQDRTCEAAAAARILTNDQNFVAWLNANPPMACYATYHADLLQALNGEITEMNYVVSGNFDAANAMVTAQNALLDKASSDGTTAATACSS